MKTEKIRGLLGLARRARTVTIGSRETRSALRRGEVRLVLLTSDGSARDRERMGRLAEESRVPSRTIATREALGSWVGRAPVAVLGILDPHIARAIRDGVDLEGVSRTRENGGEEK